MRLLNTRDDFTETLDFGTLSLQIISNFSVPQSCRDHESRIAKTHFFSEIVVKLLVVFTLADGHQYGLASFYDAFHPNNLPLLLLCLQDSDAFDGSRSRLEEPSSQCRPSRFRTDRQPCWRRIPRSAHHTRASPPS